jgi:hypothetical protein
MTINIDNEAENVDWLHRLQTRFTISKSGKKIGTADLATEEIETNYAELEEYFYLLIDEGIGDGPITKEDGAAFMEALRKQNYEVEANG